MNNIARVRGVGSWAGTIVNFFSSGLGESLLTAGIGLGTAYLGSQLNIGQPAQQEQPTQQPAQQQQPVQQQPQTIVVQTPTDEKDSDNTAMYVAIGAAALAVGVLFAGKKR